MNVTMSSLSGWVQEDGSSEFFHPHDEESEEGDGSTPDVAGVSSPQKSELPPSFELARPTGQALSDYNDLGVGIEHPDTGTSKSITGEVNSLENGTATGSGEFYSADSGDAHPHPPTTTPAPVPSPRRSPIAGSQASFPAGSRIPLPTPPLSSHSPYQSPPRSPSRFPSPSTRWKKIRRIGKGFFGTVYEALNLDDGSFFAVKVSRDESIPAEIQKEVEVLSVLRHPNVVQYFGTGKMDNGRLCIFLELMQYSLQSIIGHLDETLISTYTQQILQGLEYLHWKNTIHRDIKCANILVDRDGQVKLADFGLAKEVSTSLATSCKGTPYFMAPEIVKPSSVNERGYGLPVDIWSLGCTVLEMADGKPPWSFLEALALYDKVSKGELPPIPQHLSHCCQDFIKLCLQFRPEDWPTASQLLHHPFVANAPAMTAAAAFLPSPSAYTDAEIMSGEEKLLDGEIMSGEEIMSREEKLPASLMEDGEIALYGEKLPYQRSRRKRRTSDPLKTLLVKTRPMEDVDITNEVQKPRRIFLLFVSTICTQVIVTVAALMLVTLTYVTLTDIKCANILVDRDGQVKLADFGLAMEVGATIEFVFDPICSSDTLCVVSCMKESSEEKTEIELSDVEIMWREEKFLVCIIEEDVEIALYRMSLMEDADVGCYMKLRKCAMVEGHWGIEQHGNTTHFNLPNFTDNSITRILKQIQ